MHLSTKLSIFQLSLISFLWCVYSSLVQSCNICGLSQEFEVQAQTITLRQEQNKYGQARTPQPMMLVLWLPLESEIGTQSVGEYKSSVLPNPEQDCQTVLWWGSKLMPEQTPGMNLLLNQGCWLTWREQTVCPRFQVGKAVLTGSGTASSCQTEAFLSEACKWFDIKCHRATWFTTKQSILELVDCITQSRTPQHHVLIGNSILNV